LQSNEEQTSTTGAYQKKDRISKIVVFSIMDSSTKKKMDYGIGIEQVQEIGTIAEVTRVPGAPAHVKGVMNLRGKIITIVDMKRLLGFGSSYPATASTFSSSDRIIVAQVKQSVIGLLVDEVDQVIEILPSDIESAPTVLSETAPYINGIIKLKSNLYVLLDLQLLLENENKQISDEQDPNVQAIFSSDPGRVPENATVSRTDITTQTKTTSAEAK